MTTTTTTATATQALTERLFGATIQTLELFSIYLGKHLGLYETLHLCGPATAVELAGAAGIDARYAREWLEQQAVAGLVAVDDDSALPYDRRYSIPAGHVAVLCDERDLNHVAPLAQMLVGVAGALPDVIDAYRSGAGVPYDRYGSDFCHGQGAINRPAFTELLPKQWLPAIPDLYERLHASPPARVADIGCGEGWSTIALARAFPQADVTGYDVDARSIAGARANASRESVAVRFQRADAAALREHGPFDLALILEALHDMSRPVEVLAAIREALADDGCVIIADERVAERFAAPGNDIERLMYGWSIAHCLPVSMAEQPSAAIGTVIRPETVRNCALRAGFTSVEILPIDNELFRFYRLSAAGR